MPRPIVACDTWAMLFLDKPRALDLMIAHAEHVCVPAQFAAADAGPRAVPSLLQGPPLPVVWPAEAVPAMRPVSHPAPTPAAATRGSEATPSQRTPIPVGARGWTAA